MTFHNKPMARKVQSDSQPPVVQAPAMGRWVVGFDTLDKIGTVLFLVVVLWVVL